MTPTKPRVVQKSTPEWPADKVSRWSVDDLAPYANNARLHSDEQIAKIARSIQEFGFTVPILAAEDGTIIAGHGRLMAAKSLGMTEVPVMMASGWSDEQRRAYTLADNALTLDGTWDEDLLRIELGDLKAEGYDLGLSGFGQDFIAGLFAGQAAPLSDPEEAPEPQNVVVSMPGDIWQLGDHRLICGSSTDAEVVKALLGDERPHLMVTDPPYGVEYDASWRVGAGLNKATAAHGKVMNDDISDWREAWALFPGDVAYVWHAGAHAASVAESLTATGLLIRSQIIWAKNQMVMSRGDYHWKHEPCWYAVRKGGKGHWAGDRKQTTLWEIDKPHKSETGHSTQKPIECMKRPMENNSKPGDAVYDPFAGSATTIIAGEQIGRRVFSCELNPAYVDVGVRRWQAVTGREAILAETGETFAEVAAQRGD